MNGTANACLLIFLVFWASMVQRYALLEVHQETKTIILSSTSHIFLRKNSYFFTISSKIQERNVHTKKLHKIEEIFHACAKKKNFFEKSWHPMVLLGNAVESKAFKMGTRQALQYAMYCLLKSYSCTGITKPLEIIVNSLVFFCVCFILHVSMQ